MRVKTYRAKDISAILPTIRAELGADAVILEARPLPAEEPAGPLGRYRTPRQMIEVTAAAEELPDLKLLTHEVAEVKAAVLGLNQTTGFRRLPAASPALDRMREHLEIQGLEEEEVQTLIESIAETLATDRLADTRAVHREAMKQLLQRLPTDRPTVRPGTTLFLIGPTGVGKTTTIAKLAARAVIEQRQKVALIGIDTLRVGAIGQLETYARLLRLPLDVAYTPNELKALIGKHADKDLILVDTPGVSPLAEDALQELAINLKQAPQRHVLLALACSTRFEDMNETARRFNIGPLDGLLFTKTDETHHYGSAYRLASDLKLPLTYFTTGPKVPHDLDIATAEKLATLLLESVGR